MVQIRTWELPLVGYLPFLSRITEARGCFSRDEFIPNMSPYYRIEVCMIRLWHLLWKKWIRAQRWPKDPWRWNGQMFWKLVIKLQHILLDINWNQLLNRSFLAGNWAAVWKNEIIAQAVQYWKFHSGKKFLPNILKCKNLNKKIWPFWTRLQKIAVTVSGAYFSHTTWKLSFTTFASVKGVNLYFQFRWTSPFSSFCYLNASLFHLVLILRLFMMAVGG